MYNNLFKLNLKKITDVKKFVLLPLFVKERRSVPVHEYFHYFV